MNDMRKYIDLVEQIGISLSTIDLGFTKVIVSDSLSDEWLNTVKQFSEKYVASIKYGCKRDNCGVVAADFLVFCGEKCKKVNGYYYCDLYNNYSKKDLHTEEIAEMKSMSMDVDDKADIKKYISLKNLDNELKHIPHSWNEIDGQIIDFSGYSQFIKTGYSSSIDYSNYRNDI
jgi:hypothetical protein